MKTKAGASLLKQITKTQLQIYAQQIDLAAAFSKLNPRGYGGRAEAYRLLRNYSKNKELLDVISGQIKDLVGLEECMPAPVKSKVKK